MPKREFIFLFFKPLTSVSIQSLLFVIVQDSWIFFFQTSLQKIVTIVSIVGFNLGPIIVMYVIYGWQMMKNRITAKIVDFVVSVVLKIFGTVMIAGCVLTSPCTIITIAKVANTNRIVLYVKNFYLVLEVPRMKCLVAMRYIGNVSVNLRHMIHVVQFVRKLPKRRNG